MKITTNEFGNYSTKVNQTTVSPKQAADVQKQSLGTITKEEKKFFADLYPEKKEDVMNYHFYQKTGKMTGVTLGTLFDKRG